MYFFTSLWQSDDRHPAPKKKKKKNEDEEEEEEEDLNESNYDEVSIIDRKLTGMNFN